MNLRLIKYTDVNSDEYTKYIQEWECSNEVIVPTASRRNSMSYGELLIRWHEDETDKAYEQGFVPSTLFFMIDDTERVIGAIHLRHELNDRLRANGGHIGYGIRPSERRKGFASLMLRMLIDDIKSYSLKKVMITCDDINIASAKTIEKNGGILEDKVEFEGELTRRYWIST